MYEQTETIRLGNQGNQGNQIVAPSGASFIGSNFEQQKQHLMRQQAMERARQRAEETRLGLISAAIFAVGAYFKNPILGAAAGGAYFWMNRPEGGRLARRAKRPPSSLPEQAQKIAAAKAAGTYVAPVGQAFEGGCGPGMYNPGSGCIADHTYDPAMAKAMEGMSLGEKLGMLGSGHRY